MAFERVRNRTLAYFGIADADDEPEPPSRHPFGAVAGAVVAAALFGGVVGLAKNNVAAGLLFGAALLVLRALGAAYVQVRRRVANRRAL